MLVLTLRILQEQPHTLHIQPPHEPNLNFQLLLPSLLRPASILKKNLALQMLIQMVADNVSVITCIFAALLG